MALVGWSTNTSLQTAKKYRVSWNIFLDKIACRSLSDGRFADNEIRRGFVTWKEVGGRNGCECIFVLHEPSLGLYFFDAEELNLQVST